jgi:hypothetical protein
VQVAVSARAHSRWREPWASPSWAPAGRQKGLDLVRREEAQQVFDHSKAGYQEEILKAAGGLVQSLRGTITKAVKQSLRCHKYIHLTCAGSNGSHYGR